MKGQDNVLKIKLGCSRSPKKKRKKMDGKKKRGTWFCYQWQGPGGTFDDTGSWKGWRKLKSWKTNLSRAVGWQAVKELPSGQAGKGTADLWASGPHTAGPTRLTAECQETSQKTSGKLSALGGGWQGTGGPNEEDCTLVNAASPPESPRRVWNGD